MIISEKQILQLIQLIHKARIDFLCIRPIFAESGVDFIDISAKILNEIESQQSEELKDIK